MAGLTLHKTRFPLILEALQVSDKNKVAMPLNRKKGDKVIIPAPKTLEELEKRIADTSCEKVGFYLAKKNL